MANSLTDVFRDVFRPLQPYSTFYGFSQNNGATSTNLIDFTTRITWTATKMKFPEPAITVATTRYRCKSESSDMPTGSVPLSCETPPMTPPNTARRSVFEPLYVITTPAKTHNFFNPLKTVPFRNMTDKELIPEMYQGIPLYKTFSGPGESTCFSSNKNDFKMREISVETGKNPGRSSESEQCYLKDQRRFQCPRCEVTCANKGQLKGHLRVHTGERPFKCDHVNCNRAFARNEELTRHRRIHTGHRPHPCTLCGKHFGRKDHLNKHLKTHLNAHEKKTCVCPVLGCMQRYSRSDALARHQWNVHGIRTRSRPVGSVSVAD